MSAEINDGWWDSLRHFGLLLAPKEVGTFQSDCPPKPLSPWYTNQLRRELIRFEAGDLKKKDWIAWILQNICGFGKNETGEFLRGRNIPTSFVHSLITRENLKPTHLWTGENGAVLPVFAVDVKRIGIGRGRKSVSDVVQWLRAAGMPLGVVTNGREWRLVYAGLDFDAGCEWSLDHWFMEGQPGPQLDALRLLLQPQSFVPAEATDPPLLASILASRRGQAELSSILGERVREAVELLVQSHRDAITEADLNANGADIYRAAVRVVMRLVVILFAESRDMLPRGDPVYHNAYGLGSLFEELQRLAARGHARLNHRFSSWPRLLGLFRLIYDGSHHPDLQVPQYGGELFAPGVEDDGHALSRALHVFETACFDSQFHLMPDAVVHQMLELLTRTEIRIRQGRAWTQTSMPVDFSDLSSEYIGILYEGLLDYELRTADTDNPVVFLAVGDEPALPLARLEAMQDKDIKALFESLKDSGSSGDDEAPAVTEDQVSAEQLTEEAAPEVSEESLETQATDDPSVDDSQKESEAAQARAIYWTRHACLAASLIRKPAASASPEAKQAWEQKVDARARQLVRRVVLPGDWYLVRWGGTRKGSGTFYTRPALAVPTVQRTLRPLAYEPPLDVDGNPDPDVTAERWTPKTPESILALKICDPACGSGSFPVAAVRFLTDALYASLFEHGRLEGDWRRPLPMLLGLIPEDGEELLGYARLPSAPDADDFENRTKAVLRRFVVEHCIYGVDFDPLAAELCRLALWIETMDPELPFSFLDHKIRCGNSLVGAWFDTFAHYPAMAWSREGGDKSHGNGVHFKKGELTKAIKAHKTGAVKPDLERFLMGADLVQEDFQQIALEAHDTTLATLSELHSLPVQSAAERGRRYRDEFLGSLTYKRLKRSMDLWCSLWFWPATEIDTAPLPTSFADPSEETLKIAAAVARQNRFFHWELEFPDVFASKSGGFDAMIGNPPWETFQPESKQFFSNIDPLYRTYGKQDALRRQTEMFGDERIEKDWLEYNGSYKSISNWVKFSAIPFGDPATAEKPAERFAICRGEKNAAIHSQWRVARSKSKCYTTGSHPFSHQGHGKSASYKLFLELSYCLLNAKGIFGLIVPSGVYSDFGTIALRELFVNECRWDWLFGFENLDKIFDIESRFKFCAIIICKSGHTNSIMAAFMRRRLEDWQQAEKFSTPYPGHQISKFSPKSKAILEIRSVRDLEILEKIYTGSVLLGESGPTGWEANYRQGDFNMTTDSKLFPPKTKWESKGYSANEFGQWDGPDGKHALPLYVGKMLGQFNTSSKEWISGSGRSARWRELDRREDRFGPDYLMAAETFREKVPEPGAMRLAFVDFATAVTERTAVGACIPDFPCSHLVPTLTMGSTTNTAALLGSLLFNSFAFDFACRKKIPYLHLSWFVLQELPFPKPVDISPNLARYLSRFSASLNWNHSATAPQWLRLLHSQPELGKTPWRKHWAISQHETTRLQTLIDAIVFCLFDLDLSDVRFILRDCDLPSDQLGISDRPSWLDRQGFWRIDRKKPPELRHTILTLIAYHDLLSHIESSGGSRQRGLVSFACQNDGQGWLLPQEIKLRDYDLGRDERATKPQSVAGAFGERFVESQSAKEAKDSWEQCEEVAKSLLGDRLYEALVNELNTPEVKEQPSSSGGSDEENRSPGSGQQVELF